MGPHCHRVLLLSLFAIITTMGIQITTAQPLSAQDYALQVKPITFPVEPQSQRVLLHSSVTFSCNASLEPIPRYPEPRLSWRHNGRQLSPTSGGNREVVGHSLRSTELRINGVQVEDAGYYECVASDGNGTNYITVSRRARLEVIVVAMVPELQSVSLTSGSPRLLPCSTGASLPPDHTHWLHNGRELLLLGEEEEEEEEDTALLSDGSLLILSASPATAGSYQCVGWYGNEPLNSTEFNVSVTEEQYTGQPLVIVDPPYTTLTAGQSQNITCYVAGVTGNSSYELRWLMNGEEIEGENSSVLQLHEEDEDEPHSGTYMCEIVTEDGGMYSANSSVTVAVPPTITDPEPEFRSNFELGFLRSWPEQLAWDVKVFFSDPGRPLIIPCEVRGNPRPHVYWYRNGENITQYSDSSGRLSFEGVAGKIDSVIGVYQCFAENSAGVEYTTTRVLRNGFANPPRNFTCTVTNQDFSTNPRVILNWEPPLLDTGTMIKYLVIIRVNGVEKQRPPLVSTTSNAFDINSEGEVGSIVRVEGQPDNPPVWCNVDTATRLTEGVYPLDVRCPSEPNIPIEVKWENPAAPYYDFTLDTVTLHGICIYGSTTMENNISEEGTDVYYYDINDFSLDINGTQWENGGVCIFWGTYNFFAAPFFTGFFDIPPETCQVPVDGDEYSPGPVGLGLSCDNQVVVLSWDTCENSTVQNITLQGRCLNHRPADSWEYQNTTEEQQGNVTLEGMPADGICSFYGFYYDSDGNTVQLSPVQCIMGEEVDEHYQLINSSVLCSSPSPITAVPLSSSTPAMPPSSSTPAMPLSSSTPAMPPSSSTPAMPPSSSTPAMPLSSSTVETSAESRPSTHPPQLAPTISPTSIGQPPESSNTEYLWTVVAGGVVTVSILVVLVLLVILRCVRRRQLHRMWQDQERKHDMAQIVADHEQRAKRGANEEWHMGVDLVDILFVDDARSDTATEYDYLCKPGDPNSISIAIKPIAEGKPDLIDRFLKSQPEKWEDTAETGDSPSRSDLIDRFLTSQPEKWEDTAETGDSPSHSSNDTTAACPKSSVIVEGEINAEVIAHRLVQCSDCAASSSGYATDSYYTSDISCGLSSYHSSPSYFARKLKEVEDEGAFCNEEDRALNVERRGSERREKTEWPEVKLQEATRKQHELQERIATVLCAPKEVTASTLTEQTRLREVTEDSRPRSPPPSAYYTTDDEGYVHMGSAGHIELSTTNS